jgi:hypothetical protein
MVSLVGVKMPFCPKCGKDIRELVNYCPNCSFPVANLFKEVEGSQMPQQPVDTPLTTGTTEVAISKELVKEAPKEAQIKVYELGTRLEEVVEKIYQAEGFETRRRLKLQGKSGALNEIDIVAKKGERTTAVECKNYSNQVSIDKLRDFWAKIQDINPSWRGVFVAYNDFSSEAETFAKSTRIEMMGHDELNEKWTAISIGRTTRRGETIELEYALPLSIDYLKATQIHLQNKELVKTIDAGLMFHPYFKINYHFQGQKKDPAKKAHTFEDQGRVYVDALDGKVLNPRPTSDLRVIAKTISTLFSSKERLESENTKKTILEIKKGNPSKYSLAVGDNYEVNKLESGIDPRDAVETSIDYVIDKNTHTIPYYLRNDDTSDPPRLLKYVPNRHDVRILNKEFALVPKWIIHFESKGIVYVREIFGNSGTIIEDSISICPKHLKIGIIGLPPKTTIAVCAICGQSLCEDHVKRCSICGKWVCKEHGQECDICKNTFCNEHPIGQCSICGAKICYDCLETCPVCNMQYGKDHSQKCDKCGISVCSRCLITEGLFRKTRTCKKCISGAK